MSENGIENPIKTEEIVIEEKTLPNENSESSQETSSEDEQKPLKKNQRIIRPKRTKLQYLSSPFLLLYDWGDWLGEKIAWILGITQSRYHYEIPKAEEHLKELQNKSDIESGVNQPNLPKKINLVNHFYKQGLEDNITGKLPKSLIKRINKEGENVEMEFRDIENEKNEIKNNELEGKVEKLPGV